ncbi:MAG: endonuclease III, partial [Hymenobacteraceae bacterium]|nr:endonuclease III [Hymenobacteraceae bacterium]MDX5396355.1 endonuclease III [Hymenobacteraceae bacterium]MDX5443932.1 endonuclease III [Hymenobacteraceae bacterium]MDX5512417.1 endonuclease III [Hymenobacteraceae bacterium]
MLKKERYQHLIGYFTQNFPEPETELHYTNPFELLVAVVLSAQCTDKRVNMVTPALFERFPTPEHLAAATSDEVLPYIKSISYPNNKAKHLAGLGKMLV